MELLDCTLIGVCAVIRSNTVSVFHLVNLPNEIQTEILYILWKSTGFQMSKGRFLQWNDSILLESQLIFQWNKGISHYSTGKLTEVQQINVHSGTTGFQLSKGRFLQWNDSILLESQWIFQ